MLKIKLIAASAVAVLSASMTPTFADAGRTPDGNRRVDLYDNTNTPTRARHTVFIGRPIQFLNPGNDLFVRTPGTPYALSGNDRPDRPIMRHVGSRQVFVGIEQR